MIIELKAELCAKNRSLSPKLNTSRNTTVKNIKRSQSRGTEEYYKQASPNVVSKKRISPAQKRFNEPAHASPPRDFAGFKKPMELPTSQSNRSSVMKKSQERETWKTKTTKLTSSHSEQNLSSTMPKSPYTTSNRNHAQTSEGDMATEVSFSKDKW